ncbi:FkbM family methyltransferase [Sulfitobacter sp.]|uniref:FkbM family methyltransferase n=1 Tax=Sulfitobacter sp. TaxID=1903071 RepID=UPI0030014F37
MNEPRTLSLIPQFVGNGDIVSGGAFVGDFLPFMSRTLKRGAYVHSFEPNPTGFAAATMTLALNDIKNVKLSPVAVGRETAVLPLMVSAAAGKEMGGSSKIVEALEEGRTIDVDIVRIDDLVPEARKVSVLQLDK